MEAVGFERRILERYSTKEKDILLNLIRSKAAILENKSTAYPVVISKKITWQEIADEFNSYDEFKDGREELAPPSLMASIMEEVINSASGIAKLAPPSLMASIMEEVINSTSGIAKARTTNCLVCGGLELSPSPTPRREFSRKDGRCPEDITTMEAPCLDLIGMIHSRSGRVVFQHSLLG
uniref:Regulatory protein zeste n=1 Tax=Timema bartmani TaxID=61472 RepID=A0A7R9F7G4_9NEOP|nr:unnamed protein product [Timema bartmani]